MTRTRSLAPNLAAFLDAVAWSEIGAEMLAMSDDGYDVLVGSTPQHMLLFDDYSTHPNVFNTGVDSTAAGRYQFLGRYWPAYKVQLALPDFGPESQDKWAVQLVKECRALDDVLTGHFAIAVAKCRSRWASLPGAGYKQRENTLVALEAAYDAAGGTFA